ncbi:MULTISPECIES: hypothetical protein [Paracoccus]|uniref:hypothetical protein n=1 Tax=Paracoccus TaxID=265 RepID=UPI000868E6D9|nr:MULTISPECIES: hypothetical protein [Paracoccus]ODT60275.1 MAG: hypothetical protein ABS73_06505 [Paracoccus sp. SCN 68-21]
MFRLALTLSLATGPAWSQDMLTQCVNQCLFEYGPAGSPAYDLCVAQLCMAAAPAPEAAPPPTPSQVPAPALAQPPGPIWRADPTLGTAEIRWRGRSMAVRCDAEGGSISVSGLGGGGSALSFAVDGQRLDVPFETRDGTHYAQVEPESALLEALMAGRQVTIVAGQVTLTLPLAGSRRAISEVMADCDPTP